MNQEPVFGLAIKEKKEKLKQRESGIQAKKAHSSGQIVMNMDAIWLMAKLWVVFSCWLVHCWSLSWSWKERWWQCLSLFLGPWLCLFERWIRLGGKRKLKPASMRELACTWLAVRLAGPMKAEFEQVDAEQEMTSGWRLDRFSFMLSTRYGWERSRKVGQSWSWSR